MIFSFFKKKTKTLKISHDSPILHYAGRWDHTKNYSGSIWQSSQIRFVVENTKFIKINVKRKGAGFAAIILNDGPSRIEIISKNHITFEIPNEKTEVILKLFCFPRPQLRGKNFCRLRSLEFSENAIVSSSLEDKKKIMTIGDSWMSAGNDWTFLLKDFSIYPVAFGGATIKDLNSKFDSEKSDPRADFVFISCGVNDYHAGISLEEFAYNLRCLIIKVRKTHREAKIFLIQPPRSFIFKYDEYGEAMEKIVEENIKYISTEEVWDQLKWKDDELHLTYDGLVEFSDFIKKMIIKV